MALRVTRDALNLITALIAYTHQPKKPSLQLDESAQTFFSIVPI